MHRSDRAAVSGNQLEPEIPTDTVDKIGIDREMRTYSSADVIWITRMLRVSLYLIAAATIAFYSAAQWPSAADEIANGDLQAAYELLLPQAEQGDIEAQFSIGQMYKLHTLPEPVRAETKGCETLEGDSDDVDEYQLERDGASEAYLECRSAMNSRALDGTVRLKF